MSDVLTMPPPALADSLPSMGQALLFSSEIEKQVAVEETAGRYTAGRLREKRKPAYDAIVILLGQGVGMLRIGKLMGVHHLTVKAVKDAEPEAVDMSRDRTVGDMITARTLLLERILASPEAVPWNVLGMTIDQLSRNIELLSGRPTARTESVERIDTAGGFIAWVEASLPKERQLEEGDDVRLISSITGLSSGEKPALKAPPAAPDTDVVSDDSGPPAQVQPKTYTSSSTDLVQARPAGAQSGGVPASAAEKGAGGGSPASTVPQDPMGQTSQKFSDNDQSEEHEDV